MYISMHLPKTAGRTVRAYLDTIFEDKMFYHYLSEYEFTEPLTASLLTKIYRFWTKVKYIIIGHGQMKLRHQCIHGHFRATIFKRHFPDAKIITWVRDPVERTISHYYYWKRNPDYGSEVCKQMINEKLTLEEFASLDYMRNYQYRYFDGLIYEDFWFVGVQEYFDEDIKILLNKFNVSEIKVLENNTNPDKPVSGGYKISEELRNKIKNLNQLDYELYSDILEKRLLNK